MCGRNVYNPAPAQHLRGIYVVHISENKMTQQPPPSPPYHPPPDFEPRTAPRTNRGARWFIGIGLGMLLAGLFFSIWFLGFALRPTGFEYPENQQLSYYIGIILTVATFLFLIVPGAVLLIIGMRRRR
jgi:hypothetical protein